MNNEQNNTYIKGLFAFFFKLDNKPLEICEYQVTIARTILLKEHKRNVIVSPTRAGKSFVIALSALLAANKNSNYRIKIIAPTYKQSKIIMGYIFEHMLDSEAIINNTALTTQDVQTLGKAINQYQIGFLNGSSIEVLSAEGEGARLMGFGGDLIIVDESALITDDVFNNRILRMLGDSPNSILVEIGNPFGSNHFYEHWISPMFHKLHFTWRDCVASSRLSQDYIDEQRILLANTPAVFTRLYDAEFVLTEEDTLISSESIKDAYEKQVTLEGQKQIIFGVDVARFGGDLSVLAIIETDDDKYVLKEYHEWMHKDTTQVAGAVAAYATKWNPNTIRVDDSGVGGGVVDQLKRIAKNVTPITFGSEPRDKKRFLNLKAESYFFLRHLFHTGKIQIPKHGTLVSQLAKFKYEYTGESRVKIDDNQDKSPDFADALCIGVCNRHTKMVVGQLNFDSVRKKPGEYDKTMKMPM